MVARLNCSPQHRSGKAAATAQRKSSNPLERDKSIDFAHIAHHYTTMHDNMTHIQWFFNELTIQCCQTERDKHKNVVLNSRATTFGRPFWTVSYMWLCAMCAPCELMPNDDSIVLRKDEKLCITLIAHTPFGRLEFLSHSLCFSHYAYCMQTNRVRRKIAQIDRNQMKPKCCACGFHGTSTEL